MGNSSESPAGPVPLDADSLKLRFKKHRLATDNVHQNWQVRVHRSLSWLKRAGQFDDGQSEARFLFLWIALNSLYSRWNAERNAPDADRHARDDFLRRVSAMDAALVADTLRKRRALIARLLADPFLSEVFWRDPAEPKAKGRATADANYLDRNLKKGDHCRVLSQAMQRLFVLRGQIVHGASSGGSRLNRSSLKNCLQLLEVLVPIIQHIVIDRGCHDDWPDLCYPPQP